MATRIPNPYAISSNLLYELLTYGDGLTSKRFPAAFNWTNDNTGYCKPLVTWLASKAFTPNIAIHLGQEFGLPTPDAQHCEKMRKNLLDILNAVPANELCNAIDELTNIYKFSQLELAKHPRLINDAAGVPGFNLGRVIRDTGAGTIKTNYTKALAEKIQDCPEGGVVSHPFQLLSSWGWLDDYYNLDKDHDLLRIQTFIPLSDILLFSDLISSRSSGKAIERGEFIVVSRALSKDIPCADVRGTALDRLKQETQVKPC